MTALLEATVISAGFAAAAASFMISSDSVEQYNRYAKYTHVSIILFAASAGVESIAPGATVTPFMFSAGWVMLLTSLGAATFSAEIVGVQANIRHRIQWLYQFRIRGWLQDEPRTPTDITYQPLELGFLRRLYEGTLVRGASVFISGASETNPELFAYQIAVEGLRNDEHVIYINTNRIPEQVRNDLRDAGVSLDRFHIIDIYNPSFGLGEIPITGVKEEHRAKTLKGIHGEIRRIRMKIGLEDDRFQVRIIYDDINLLADIMGIRGMNKFILHSLPVERVLGWVSVYVGSTIHDETPIYDTIWELSDVILHLETDHVGPDASNHVKLVKAQDCEQDDRWHPYSVYGRATRYDEGPDGSRENFVEIHTLEDDAEGTNPV